MKLWPFSRKATTPGSWSSLTRDQQLMVARKIAGAALALCRRAHFGRGYEAVTFPFS
jgi:hypothetical protein